MEINMIQVIRIQLFYQINKYYDVAGIEERRCRGDVEAMSR